MLNMKFTFLTICAIYVLISLPNESSALGGSNNLSGRDLQVAVTILEKALSKLSAGDGPSYKLAKVNSATKQVVAGTLYKYNVDLVNNDKNARKCDVEIWTRQWLVNGNQVTIACSGEKVIRYSA